MINFGYNTETLIVIGIVLVIILALGGIIIWSRKTSSQVKAIENIRETLAREGLKKEGNMEAKLHDDTLKEIMIGEVKPKEVEPKEKIFTVGEELKEIKKQVKEADYITKDGKAYFRSDIEKQIRD